MPYSAGARLSGESASKLGHLTVIQSDWVRELVREFEATKAETQDLTNTLWETYSAEDVTPLRNVWAVDGSYVSIQSEQKPPREVAFVKTALLTVDRVRLEAID